jgi:hypothetical protein
MSGHPDWKVVCQRVYVGFILMPRWASICRSMSKAAMAGDVAAARWVRDQIDSGDAGLEEAITALEREGQGGLERQAATLQLELHQLLAAGTAQEAPEKIIQAAARAVVAGAVAEAEAPTQAGSWYDHLE